VEAHLGGRGVAAGEPEGWREGDVDDDGLAAHDQLQEEGIAVRVIDLFSVHPIDKNDLAASAQDAGGNVIVVEDHYLHGGIGTAVLSALAQERVRVQQLGVREIARSGKPKELLDKFGISARHIVEAVRAVLAQPHRVN